MEYLQFYNDNTEYQIDHTYNKCEKLTLGPWRNHTIPVDAVLEDQYDVGPPGNPIIAQEWSDRTPGRYSKFSSCIYIIVLTTMRTKKSTCTKYSVG